MHRIFEYFQVERIGVSNHLTAAFFMLNILQAWSRLLPEAGLTFRQMSLEMTPKHLAFLLSIAIRK